MCIINIFGKGKEEMDNQIAKINLMEDQKYLFLFTKHEHYCLN